MTIKLSDYKLAWETDCTAKLILEEDGIIIAANNAAVKLLGKKNLTEFNFTDLLSKESSEKIPLKKLFQSSPTKKLQLKFRKRYNSSLPVEVYSILLDKSKLGKKYLLAIKELYEEKLSKKKPYENIELLSGFIKHSPIYAFIKESSPNKSRFIQVSDSFEQLIGSHPKFLIGKSMEELFSLETAAKLTRDDWHVVSKKMILKIDETINERNFETIKFPINIKNKNYLAGYTIDVTASKLFEKKLKDSLNHLKFHVEHTPLATIEFNNQYEIIQWSEKAEQMFGWKIDEVLGKKINELKWVHEDDKERVTSLSLNMLKNKDTSNVHMNRNYRKDGSVIFCTWYNSAFINSYGEMVSVYSLVEDITRQKMAEEELTKSKILLSQSQQIGQVGSWEYDIHDNILIWSEETYRIFEVSPDSFNLTYDNFIGLIHPDDKEPVNTAYLNSIKYGQETYQIEHRIISSSGEVRYLFEKCVHIYNDHGTITHSVGFVQDITERKRIEMALEKQTEELKELNNTKDKLFSIIAHDLRSPFQGLLGMTDMISEKIETLTQEELAELLLKLNHRVKYLFKLLKNLLDWSMIQQNKTKVNLCELNLLELIVGNIALIQTRCEDKNIQVIHSVDTEINVFADEAMINSILANLLSNAVKFTKHGGTIQISTTDVEPNMVAVSICDSGVGMDEITMSKLFKVEEKVGHAGTDGEESTGLGLILCKDFIGKLGGKIWVESEENKGSTFTFTIPKFTE